MLRALPVYEKTFPPFSLVRVFPEPDGVFQQSAGLSWPLWTFLGAAISAGSLQCSHFPLASPRVDVEPTLMYPRTPFFADRVFVTAAAWSQDFDLAVPFGALSGFLPVRSSLAYGLYVRRLSYS